jgi:hypothetical protein
MKKMLSIVLVFSMLLTALPVYGLSVNSPVSQDLMEDTIRALGVMNGDEKGDLRLGFFVKRSEFAQMMVQGSIYKDTVSGGSNTSIFSDVNYTHWAAEPIKIAVNAGWFSGYLDGTFKPDNYIRIEEVATAILRLLGYTASDLNGSYPMAQLSKFNSLGLNDGVGKTEGKYLTRGDLLVIFYNLMETDTKAGRPYGETLGYLMVGGKIDYSTLVGSVTSGPFVFKGGDLFRMLPFTRDNVTYFRDGRETADLAIQPYDVYYYSKNLRTIWTYSQKVSGLYTKALPSAVSPTSVMVAGNTYAVGTGEATYKLSDRGNFSIGEMVTLLIGMNGEVVDVIAPDLANGIQYGVVTKSEKVSYEDGAGRIIIDNSVMVACTDGVLRQYMTGNTLFSKGNIVSVTISNTETVVKNVSPSYFSGSLNSDVTRYGTYEIAKGVEIIDTNTRGDFMSVYPQRLEGSLLSSYNIRYFTLNEDGKVDRLILNNVTGDLETYGMVTDVEETTTVIESPPSADPLAPVIPPVITMTGIYEYQINGMKGIHTTNGKLLEISTGPSVFWYVDGKVDNIYNMSGFILDSLNQVSATRLNETYKVAQDVQVYQRVGGEYFLVNVATVSNTNEFNLVGYRDSGFRAGGLIRVIVATKK